MTLMWLMFKLLYVSPVPKTNPMKKTSKIVFKKNLQQVIIVYLLSIFLWSFSKWLILTILFAKRGINCYFAIFVQFFIFNFNRHFIFLSIYLKYFKYLNYFNVHRILKEHNIFFSSWFTSRVNKVKSKHSKWVYFLSTLWKIHCLNNCPDSLLHLSINTNLELST